MPRTLIIGGGIAGLSCAWYLQRAGVSCTLLEPQRLGGLLRTDVVLGCQVEAGPDSYLAAKTAATELIGELGLADQLISPNEALRATYLVRDGQLVPYPHGLVLFAPKRWDALLASPLLSEQGKQRAQQELQRPTPDAPQDDISVATFVRDHYGEEVLSYLAEPLLAGVYGGDPEHLSARSVAPKLVQLAEQHGSVSRALADEPDSAGPLFHSLQGGMGSLVEALSNQLSDQINIVPERATAIRQHGPEWHVETTQGTLTTDSVVLACPAHIAGRLLETVDADAATAAQAIPYCSSMLVALVYDRATVQHSLHGFGFLVPHRERNRLMACTWVNSKFPIRVPGDRVLLRCFFGGAQDAAVVNLSDEEATQLAREELRHWMGVEAVPLAAHVQRWPDSMPQYTVGHGQRLQTITERLAHLPTLQLAGNAYHGVGVPDAIRSGRTAAEALLRR